MSGTIQRLAGAVALAAGLAMASPAAAVGTAFGQAVRENFEGYALGPLSLQFCSLTSAPATMPDDCLGILSGGSIALGTPQFPAVSGTQIYAGTDILFDIATPVDYFWPGVAFTLHSGDSAVQVNIDSFDVDAGQYVNLFNLLVPAFSTGVNIFAGTDAMPVQVHRFTLQSASQLAIDDLQVGLETVEPGIPEPATWLLLIAGFGAVGVRLRQRHWRAA